MREIKFRGLDKSGVWHYGDLWRSPDGICFIRESIVKTHNTDFEVITESVGQFTGLEDRNGKDIYEGDIIGYCGNIGEVVFEDSVASFKMKINGRFPQISKMIKAQLEVIRNIHENLELLSQKEGEKK